MSRNIATELYSAAQVRELDRRAIEDLGIPGYTLMQRAALAAWTALCDRWPAARSIAIVCGNGNNGGDGYEMACLAHTAGREVRVFEIDNTARRGDAALARSAWLKLGVAQPFASGAFEGVDVIVDAVFGTGLSRAPEGLAAEAIKAINAAHSRGIGVLAVDIPSGLMADTGTIAGLAVDADLTVTFIGRKLGLHTGQGPAQTGLVVFDSLAVPASVSDAIQPLAQLLQRDSLRTWLPPRRRTEHKGSNGHVLLIGGDSGMSGAILIAARAALRAGAGRVSVATRAAHAAVLTAAQPEIMFHGIESDWELADLLPRVDVVAIGPGLGQDDWGDTMLELALDIDHPLVLDADALNLLATSTDVLPDISVLTPHPGEAGRLLGTSSAAVEADRVAAIHALKKRFGGIWVLKGAGSLVLGEELRVCPYGNPGMAVGGMGDALTGIVAGFIAQGLPAETATAAAVMCHALAGDLAASVHGERGLIASDLINELGRVVNP